MFPRHFTLAAPTLNVKQTAVPQLLHWGRVVAAISTTTNKTAYFAVTRLSPLLAPFAKGFRTRTSYRTFEAQKGLKERIRIPDTVTFSATTEFPPPHPAYIALHAVCCGVTWMSGVAEYFVDIERRMDQTGVLARDERGKDRTFALAVSREVRVDVPFHRVVRSKAHTVKEIFEGEVTKLFWPKLEPLSRYGKAIYTLLNQKKRDAIMMSFRISFIDFCGIAILPTADELSSNKNATPRRPSYLDNTFRLLRDDMMHELKEDTDTALKKKQRRQRGLIFDGIKAGVQEKDRKRFFCDDHRGSRMLRRQSLACLIGDGAILGLGTIHRDEQLLAERPPIIPLLKSTKHLRLIRIDCAAFAFEPVLKALENIREPAIGQDWSGPPLLHTPNSIILDIPQAASLLAWPEPRVSLIRGSFPNSVADHATSGSGKSFIGALLAKALRMYTSQTIFVVCYTNHALDQFLEDLIGVGIPREDIPSPETSLAHTESKDPKFFRAFRVPDPEDVMRFVGRKGKVVDETFLVCQWMQGSHVRMFKNGQVAHRVWNGDDFARQFKKTLVEQLRTKGIIGCTMTGAAKFAEDARAASPDVSLVEEVLENRVVTAQLNKTASQNDSRWGPQGSLMFNCVCTSALCSIPHAFRNYQ
ncbi:hypothetical protein BKA83DRAFT_4124296 [Pisolithus microcarpus]|nr:hypothetical protein BKA83DRAFT_4124296 [Pisolithus microcarpus]